MSPELHEYGEDSHRPGGFSSAGPEYVGAPSELADEAEAPAVVQQLVTVAAGVGLVMPLIIAGLFLISCLVCVVIARAAGLG